MSKYKHEQPIVMPRGRKYGANYWIFHSRKTGRQVTCYSNLEYDNLTILEMDNEIEYYCEQPCEISLILDGDEKKSVFDVWVYYRDGKEEYQEVKYLSDVTNPDPESRVRRQITLQRKWCDYNSQNYVVRTEKDIYRGQYYIQNLRYMATKVRRYNVPHEIQMFKEREIIQFMEKHYVTVEDLCSCGIIPKGMEPDFLSMMYYKGLIRFTNIEDMIINAKTEVYLNG